MSHDYNRSNSCSCKEVSQHSQLTTKLVHKIVHHRQEKLQPDVRRLEEPVLGRNH